MYYAHKVVIIISLKKCNNNDYEYTGCLLLINLFGVEFLREMFKLGLNRFIIAFLHR